MTSMNRVKIGIVSDSHRKIGLLEDAISVIKKEGCTHIIHAGDIVLKESLELLKNSGLDYTAVLGNNDIALIEYMDKYNLFKEPHYFKLGDLTFKLMHLPYFLSGDADVVIYGHTHYFKAEKKGKTLYLNPGEICARKKPLSEFAILETKGHSYIVKRFLKEPDGSRYECEEFSYE